VSTTPAINGQNLRQEFFLILLRCCWVTVLILNYVHLRCRQADVFETVSSPISFTGDQLIAGVNDSGDKHKISNTSANFHKKFEMSAMGYSGPRGKLIHEKT
jgi:hypothetical protein